MFAWTTADMPGVSPDIITHRLSIYKEGRPITMGEEKHNAARKETEKVTKAGFIRKAHCTTWLTNVVVVKKSNGKWKMCVDYTDLNKACPKDSYVLPSIDSLVDGAANHTICHAFNAPKTVISHPGNPNGHLRLFRN